MIDGRSTRAALALAALGLLGACRTAAPPVAAGAAADAPPALKPLVVTPRVATDTDDPAIWINPLDPARSLVIGTEKHPQGSLHAYDLDGRIVATVRDLLRPNNVDVEYGLAIGGQPVDVAVVTERLAHRLRVFRLPELTAVDGGGLPVFEGEGERDPMGVALYKRPRDGAVFAVVSRKSGPRSGYLAQYRLEDGGGALKATKVRSFGAVSGAGEIEASAVDDALGFIYYSDEGAGIRKYHADPEAPDAERELALFGTDGFRQDREGISIYTVKDGTGYLLVSDQQAQLFRFYPREGAGGDPHAHPLLKTVRVSTVDSDGSEVTSAALGPRFPAGLFVAMSEGGTFHYYAWPDLAGPDLAVAPDGRRHTGVTTP